MTQSAVIVPVAAAEPAVATQRAFPQHQPCGGVFADVVPHLTVGERRRGSSAELRVAERTVSRALPIDVTVDHAVLIAGTEAPGGWRTVRRLPLGPHQRGA